MLFVPDLGRLEEDRGLLAAFLGQAAADTAGGGFLRELAAAARAAGPLTIDVPGDGAAVAGVLTGAYERARAQGTPAAAAMLRVLAEWERFAANTRAPRQP